MENVVLFMIISSILCMIQPTLSDPRVDLIYKKCGKRQAQNVSVYNENYDALLRSMQEEMKANKFAVAEEGVFPNRVYALAHCMNDLSGDDCAICFSKIHSLLPGCFPSASSRVLFDGCFMRIDNRNFFQESFFPKDEMRRCSDDHENSEQYNSTARDTINKVVTSAPIHKGYEVGLSSTSNGVAIHAMANCWKSLDSTSCASCLNQARDIVLQCLPSTEGRVLLSGCYLRYSDYEFANESGLLSDQVSVFPYMQYVLLAIGICVLATVVGYMAGRTFHNKRSVQRNKANDFGSSDMMIGLQFNYAMLEKATDDFNESNKIGQGRFGEVYKGTLADGREIAIKRLLLTGELQRQQVRNEVDIFANAQHKNLVRYLGCCFTNEASLLVYEFLPNKSLDLILFDPEKKTELDWKKRLGIIIGTAEGLEYLHKRCRETIIHRDIKTSNILLDMKHKPKISDFGLARFHSSDHQPAIADTLGHMAPEYLVQGRLTEKVDVYSFGVLVLEIVSGTRNNFEPKDSLNTLVTATWKHFQRNTQSEIIDKSLEVEDNMEEVLRMIHIGLLCTQELPVARPTMTTVIEMLRKKDVELPIPSKPPFVVESLTIRSTSLESSKRNRTVSSETCYFDAENEPRW